MLLEQTFLNVEGVEKCRDGKKMFFSFYLSRSECASERVPSETDSDLGR